jgi:signal transduction histidine kinase
VLVFVELYRQAQNVRRDNARLHAEVSDARRARNEFLAQASHELKTPLSSLILHIQSLELLVKAPPEEALANHAVADKLEAVDRQIQRLTGLINNMFDGSHLLRESPKIVCEELDLVRVTTEACVRFQGAAKVAGAALSMAAPARITGFFERATLDQVLANLLTNAIRHCNRKPIEVGLVADDKVASLRVRDRGAGIALEDRERIFDQFATTTKAGTANGLGLGLFIVRQLVERHGGKVRIESVLDQGSTFIVDWPLNYPRQIDGETDTSWAMRSQKLSASCSSKMTQT